MHSISIKVILFGACIYVLLSIALSAALGPIAFGAAYFVLGSFGVVGMFWPALVSQAVFVFGAGYFAGRMITTKTTAVPVNHGLLVGLLASAFELVRSFSLGAYAAIVIALLALSSVPIGSLSGKRAMA